MSRVLLGAIGALLACLGLTLNGHLTAQENEDQFGLDAEQTERHSSHDSESTEDYINGVLDSKLKSPIQFDAEFLSDVLARIADEYDLPIVFDHAALDEVAISIETEVTLPQLQKMSLRSALKHMFRQPGLEDLTFIIEEEVLLITTEDRANESLRVVIYRVDDFELAEVPNGGGGGGFVKSNFSPLIEVITTCIEHDSWQSTGEGEGAIHLAKPGMLVIAQTHKVHTQIEAFLDQLREVKTDIENSSHGGGF